MPSLARLAYWEIILLHAGFFAIVFFKLLTGGIKLQGLFYGTGGDGTAYFSPGRVQLLVFTLSAALQYLTQVIVNPSAFPPLPDALVAALAGSQAFYLGGKAYAMWAPKLLNRLQSILKKE